MDLGKPLFMVPKDFKEKILLNMDSEIKLNYLVWILMWFMILIIRNGWHRDKRLTCLKYYLWLLYTQDAKLMISIQVIFVFEWYYIVFFDLYCYTEDLSMKSDEFKFMIEKLITITS